MCASKIFQKRFEHIKIDQITTSQDKKIKLLLLTHLWLYPSTPLLFLDPFPLSFLQQRKFELVFFQFTKSGAVIEKILKERNPSI